MATAEQNLSDHGIIEFKGLKNLRIGIVWADWNFEITNNLKNGALDFLKYCNESVCIKRFYLEKSMSVYV